MSEQELEEALREIRRILSSPKEEVEKWANDLLDKAIKGRRRR